MLNTPDTYIDDVLSNIVRNTIIEAQTCGVDWPDDAVFALVVRTQAWPTNMGNPDVRFYKTKFAALRQVVKYYQWAKFEDNHFQISLLEWDLGPNHRHTWMA